jgi:hypothetical protein
MNRIYLKKNITLFSILLFLILFSLLNYFKPSFLYNNNGSLRQFGIGNSKKTIVPIWLLSIILGILCYLFILFYLNLPKLI